MFYKHVKHKHFSVPCYPRNRTVSSLIEMEKKQVTKHKMNFRKRSNCLKTNNSGSGLKRSFKNIVSNAKKQIHKLKPKCKKAAIELAIAAVKELTGNSTVNIPRVIPIPKTGGVLPFIPIFAGLSAAGSLAGGAASIVKAVNAINLMKKKFQELKRHNEKMETICIGKGLSIKPYRNGLGIYTKKEKN